MTEGCVFCYHGRLREADLYLENELCIYSWTRDPRDPPDVIPGCGVIVPKAHRAGRLRSATAPWPPATTSSPSATKLPSASPPSTGAEVREHHGRRLPEGGGV